MRPFGGLISWDSVSELQEHCRRFGRSLLVGDYGAQIYSTILPGETPLMLGILAGSRYEVPGIVRLNEDLFVIAYDDRLTFVDIKIGKVISELELHTLFFAFIPLPGWSFLAVYELDVLRVDSSGSIAWHIGTVSIITDFRLVDDDTLSIRTDDGTVARLGLGDGRAVDLAGRPIGWTRPL